MTQMEGKVEPESPQLFLKVAEKYIFFISGAVETSYETAGLIFFALVL